MPLFKRNLRKVVDTQRYDGPGAKTGDACAYFMVYAHDDDSIRTVEHDRGGRHLAEYEGEPEFPDDASRTPNGDSQPPKAGPAAKAADKPADAPPRPAKTAVTGPTGAAAS
jgi:hypothetical protein